MLETPYSDTRSTRVAGRGSVIATAKTANLYVSLVEARTRPELHTVLYCILDIAGSRSLSTTSLARYDSLRLIVRDIRVIVGYPDARRMPLVSTRVEL